MTWEFPFSCLLVNSHRICNVHFQPQSILEINAKHAYMRNGPARVLEVNSKVVYPQWIIDVCSAPFGGPLFGPWYLFGVMSLRHLPGKLIGVVTNWRGFCRRKSGNYHPVQLFIPMEMSDATCDCQHAAMQPAAILFFLPADDATSIANLLRRRRRASSHFACCIAMAPTACSDLMSHGTGGGRVPDH